ncbi:MAG TPA: citrate lyase subunit alpha [Candidatus Bathyarchaeia archaeon]|nr:citrate lyase subunit alpha [Candidatus Bathyarchaeia archaeon]
MEFVKNAIGRRVPTEVNGAKKRPYKEAYDPSYSDAWAGRPGKARMRHGASKVTTLDEVVGLLESGDWISYPHYYREGDHCLRLVVESLKRHGKKNIKILGNAFFDCCVPWLPEAMKDGTIGGLVGNCYREMGKYLTAGEFLPWVVTGVGHGDRVRKFHTGEIKVKVAFGPVPVADRWGNANGLLGKSDHWVGPLGLFLADSLWAENTCLMAGDVSERYVFPRSLSMCDVDYVVKVDNPGDASGVGSGTLDIDKIRANKFNSQIAAQVMKVMESADVIFDGFNFQVGSGAGLIVLDELHKILKGKKIQAGFAIGGCTSLHVDMLKDGAIANLLHGQCFEPSEKVITSMLHDHNHHEISTGEYDDMANKENAVNMLDVSVLTTLEMDVHFNVNSICAGGRIVGGIGGAQGVAAGSKMTIMFLPIATGKEGKSFPRIVKDVYSVSIPGEVIDVAVTEEYIALNPKSKSPYIAALRKSAKAHGLNVVTIEELHDLSVKKAAEMGKTPPSLEPTDVPVEVIEWRDGTLLDTLFKPAAKK